MALYFIAILPPEAIREDIKLLKLEIAEKFGAKHALKLPAHITVQKPFKLEEEHEEELINCLQLFGQHQKTFHLHLKNFGSFPPRVLYIDVKNKQPVIDLFRKLQKVLLSNNFISETEKNFHPHLTLATRDLEKKVFSGAWTALKARDYSSSFLVHGIFLLKHTGKYWEVLPEVPFQN